MEKKPFKRNPHDHTKIVQTKETQNDPLVNKIVNSVPSYTDPNGSYTGLPLDENEKPVQDADDL